MSIGENIKRSRTANGLRQADLAELLDVSPNYIAQIETGRKLPPLRLVDRISDELNVKVSELMEGDKMISKIREELRLEIEELYRQTVSTAN